jgi:hypothetical protein
LAGSSGGSAVQVALLDHLVGSGQKRFWDRKAERLGGFEVDDEFEFGRELNG